MSFIFLAPVEKFRENQQINLSTNQAIDAQWRSRRQRTEPLLHHNPKLSTNNHHQSNNHNRHYNSNNENNEKPQWRGKPVIYDSERSSRTPLPHAVPEKMCESLIFESRFESGNLRQVRRM